MVVRFRVGVSGREEEMKRLGLNLLISVAAFLLVAVSVWSQATTSLRGTVTDATGAVIPGAKVVLTNPSNGATRTTATGRDGVYELLQVQPGSYNLRVRATGFKDYSVRHVQLLVSSPATLDVHMAVGSETQVVSVTSQAATLNTTDATLGTPFTENQVVQLPIESRNVVELLSLQAGVVYTGDRTDIDTTNDTRNGAVNGVRSDQSNVTLDGIDVNDQAQGFAFTSILRQTPDSLQEFRVTTTNYNADQGRSAGAQVTLVTKSGTNKFHGSAYEYLRNTATSANDWFVKQDELQSGQPNVPPQLNRNIFGGSVGGPIWKDRAYFFTNLDFRTDREQQSVIQTVPSALLRQGIVQYQTADNNTFQLSPTQLTAMDPLHLGPDPAVMKYFQSYPLPNNNSVGDGYNFVGYGFPGYVKNNYYTYIARFDFHLNRNGTQNLFWRGDLDNDYVSGPPFLPGEGPENAEADYSKGYALGLISSFGPSITNSLTWGETRQSTAFQGDYNAPYIIIRGLSQNFNFGHNYVVPVHEIHDALTWSHGTHTLDFGGSVRFINNNRSSLENSFSYAYTNSAWLDSGGLANQGGALDPAVFGYPAVNSGFDNAYDFPVMGLLGIVSEDNAIYNYTASGEVLPQGAPVSRYFSQREYEPYAQDEWRIKPNLTVTYGLRYSLQSPVWENHGNEVVPNVNMSQYFSEEASNAAKGIPESKLGLISFNHAGPKYGNTGYYPWDYHDFAPRFAVAYAPHPQGGFLRKIFGSGEKTSIRAGFGIAYDHFGEGLVDSFDANGAFGLSTQIDNAANIQDVSCAPRLTSMTVIPANGCGGPILIPAPPAGFPATPPSGAFDGGLAIAQGVDNGMVTPYSYMFNFTIDREITPNTVLSLSYVGNLGRHLLAQEDMTTPLNLVDPKTHVSYFQAAQALANVISKNVPVAQVTPSMVGKTAAYWSDLFPDIASLSPGICGTGVTNCTPLQAVYATYQGIAPNWTDGIYNLDVPGIDCPNGCSSLGPYAFYQPQYSSLYAWRSVTNSSYNALEVSLVKKLSKGVQYDFNYTYSKCIDVESDAERAPVWGGYDGQIVNAWMPNQLRGVCDYDMTHQVNANWVGQLPFGRGQRFGSNVGGALDALIGGWQLGGIFRWTSGLPFNIDNGYNFPTDWQLEGTATMTGPAPKTGTTKFGDGTVNVFPQPATALASFSPTLPGASGIRNALRADGFFGFDANLAKRWVMPWSESQSLQFRWEVFNVPNATRFNIYANRDIPEIDIASTFGNYTGLLTNPRVMQFVLRYEF
jgi:Carboxypeptidase regulatory-like domain